MSLVGRVAVIIVNYNAGDYLRKSVISVKNQDFKDFSIIVVDNASKEFPLTGQEDWMEGVTLIKLEKNIGFAAANNLAVESAEGCEWIALLNPDAFAHPNWLSKLMQATERWPGYSVFASRMVNAANPDLLDGAGDVYCVSGRAYRRGYLENAAGLYCQDEDVFAPCGGAALYRRSVFLGVGKFDEDFFCYMEDVDLGCRLQLAGYRCKYISAAIVDHVGSGITGLQSEFTVYHGHRNLEWVFFKNMPGFLLLLYLPIHVFLVIGSVASYSCRGMARVILRAKLDALRGLSDVKAKRRSVQLGRSISLKAFRRIMSYEPIIGINMRRNIRSFFGGGECKCRRG